MLSGANIKHVFVLMLENRSFDHLLGFSGITGTDAVSLEPRTIPTPTGSNRYREATYTQATPAINPMPVDPGHEFTDTVEELCGPGVKYPRGGPYPPITNSGYVANYMAQPGAVPGADGAGETLRPVRRLVVFDARGHMAKPAVSARGVIGRARSHPE
jgi:phospholipase C